MSSIRFGFKSLLVMFQKTLFFCRVFKVFFAFACKTLIFLCWLFLLLVLNFCVFFWFLLLLLDTSSCYVLVSVFVVLGFLGLLVCYVSCFFWFVFGFFCFIFFGRFRGQVRWPKGPPQLTLNPLCLFCCAFVLFLFVLLLLFCLFLSLVLFCWL